MSEESNKAISDTITIRAKLLELDASHEDKLLRIALDGGHGDRGSLGRVHRDVSVRGR